MKYKTSARELKKGYPHIISVGYCDMAHMLWNRSPIAYSAGTYGWNFDIYDLHDVMPGLAICSGYRGMPKGYKTDYKTLRNAEAKAKEDRENADKILSEFVQVTIANAMIKGGA